MTERTHHHHRIAFVIGLVLQAADLLVGLGGDHDHTAEAIALAVAPHI